MSKNSKIEWTSHTWPVVTGCTKVSAGCDNCYAIKDSWRLSHNPNPKVSVPYRNTVVKKDGELEWSGVIKTHPDRLDWVSSWKEPSIIFVGNMGDLFHKDVPVEFIDQVFAVMANSNHIFQVLTKRPKRMLRYLTNIETPKRIKADVWPLPNIHIGVSVEDQRAADTRIPSLLQIPGLRFISCEPLLAELDLSMWVFDRSVSVRRIAHKLSLNEDQADSITTYPIDWVIAGGESGSKARVCHTDWLRSLIQQCRVGNVPIFIKQLGSAATAGHTIQHYLDLKDKKGGNIDEWPEDLRVRQFPGER